MAAASTASQAEQARYQNTLNDLVGVASSNGVEEGFARIFRTLNAGLGESNGLVRGLSESFNEATKFADDLLLFPQSFIRALEGKDSVVADFLGVDKTAQLIEDWKQLQMIFTQISNIKIEDIFGDFLPSLESTSRELAAIINFIAQGKNILSGNLPNQKIDTSNLAQIDPFGTGGYTDPLELAKASINNFLVGVNEYGQRKDKINATTDPTSPYYNDPVGYEQEQKDRAIARQEDEALGVVNNNNITLQVNVDAATLGNIDIEQQAQLLTQRIALNLEQVLVNFPNVE